MLVMASCLTFWKQHNAFPAHLPSSLLNMVLPSCLTQQMICDSETFFSFLLNLADIHSKLQLEARFGGTQYGCLLQRFSNPYFNC